MYSVHSGIDSERKLTLIITLTPNLFLCVERLMADPVVQQINNVTAYVGDNVTVTCKAYSYAIPHFQWLIYSKVNNNMTVLRPKLKEYEYLIPTGKDKLHGVKLFLPNVSFEDEKEYTCLVGNYIGYGHRSFFLHVLPRIHTSASGKLLIIHSVELK